LNAKIEKIEGKITKLRKSISDKQEQLKKLEKMKAQIETEHIVAEIRSIGVSPNAFNLVIKKLKEEAGKEVIKTDEA